MADALASLPPTFALSLLLLTSALTVAGCEDFEHDDAPGISAERVRPHADHGRCTACHIVMPATRFIGAGPLITPNQVRPHPDRGACTNCHAVAGP